MTREQFRKNCAVLEAGTFDKVKIRKPHWSNNSYWHLPCDIWMNQDGCTIMGPSPFKGIWELYEEPVLCPYCKAESLDPKEYDLVMTFEDDDCMPEYVCTTCGYTTPSCNSKQEAADLVRRTKVGER